MQASLLKITTKYVDSMDTDLTSKTTKALRHQCDDVHYGSLVEISSLPYGYPVTPINMLVIIIHYIFCHYLNVLHKTTLLIIKKTRMQFAITSYRAGNLHDYMLIHANERQVPLSMYHHG